MIKKRLQWVEKIQAGTKERQVRTERAVVRFLGRKMKLWSGSTYDPVSKIYRRKFVSGSPIGNYNLASIRELAAKLKSYHGLRFRKFGRIAIKGVPRKRGTYLDAVTHYVRLLKGQLVNPVHPQTARKVFTVLDAIESQAKADSSFSTRDDFSLIHRDLHPLNVVRRKKGIELIDWGSAATWDPALDVALMIAKNDFSKRKKDIFLRAYCFGSIDNTLTQRVQLYLPLAYFSLALFDEKGINNVLLRKAFSFSKNIIS